MIYWKSKSKREKMDILMSHCEYSSLLDKIIVMGVLKFKEAINHFLSKMIVKKASK